MTRAGLFVALGAAGFVALLAACGSDSGVTPTPAPSPVSGSYTFVFQPGASCRLPAATYQVGVQASQITNGTRTELHATLPGNNPTLSLELLFTTSDTVRGSLSTQTDVAVSDGNFLFLRTIAMGTVTRAADGRGEIVNGSTQGDMTVTPPTGVPVACNAFDHRWSLRAR